MKETNYQEVAGKYDRNRKRHHIRMDEELLRVFERHSFSAGSPMRVLDLGCGTGNYLSVQMDSFETETAGGLIEWYGMDASDAMLKEARRKLSRDYGHGVDRTSGADLCLGDAHQLPHGDNFFHFVSCNFAFHHFTDKEKVMDEVRRVLDSGSVFKIWNIQPEQMPGWWVYRFFPQSFLEDSERFWDEKRMWLELEKRGFQVKIKSTRTLQRRPIKEIIQDIDRRDISELANLDDSTYSQGVTATSALYNECPSATVPDEFSQVTIIAEG